MSQRNNINKKVKKILDLLKDDEEENKNEDSNRHKKKEKEKDKFKSNPNENNNKKVSFDNKKENNNINKEKEKENLLNNFNIFINEEDIPYEEEEDKNTIECKENEDEIKIFFESNKNIKEKDNFEKGVKLNKYCDINSNLNNELNPFINTENKSKKLDEDIILSDETEIKNNNDSKKDEKDITTEKILINDLFIEKENLVCEFSKGNECYQYIIYGGKKFYLMTKKNDISKYNNLYYYCLNHRTTKNSEIYTSKNIKKKISICNAKILYEKNTKNYYFMKNHSDECLKKLIQKYENYKEINLEINNYQNFRKGLLDFLNTNPTISYHDFIKEGEIIYNQNKCSFDIKTNTFSNIYYNWRKNSNSFNKFSIYDHTLTNNNKPFLRDYTYKTIYSKDGNSIINHEHVIYVSDFYIKKLRESKHFYIDGTFVYPKGFKQLIVILYYDQNLEKRYPGVFALINNKTENGYKNLFKSIFEIITIENSKDLKLESYSTDFEVGLMNALEEVFPNKRKIGCFFHYTRALREKMKKLGLLTKEKLEKSKEILNEFFLLPYTIDDELTSLDNICNKYEEYSISFINYFRNQWFRFFQNGSLIYKNLDKKFRSNSYIENYNRIVKLKLSKFLYGKSKTKITWPLFHYFILQEEEEYKKEYNKYEISLDKKIIKEKNIISQENLEDNNIINKNRKWFKLNNFSCRYDTFMFIYTFAIKPNLEKNDCLKMDNYEIVKFFNILSNDILKLNTETLGKGIWNILDNYKANYSFINDGYKQYYSIFQLFFRLEKNPLFCFKYKSIEGCSNCTNAKTEEIFFSPIINFDTVYINMFNIEGLIKNFLKNENSVCSKCGYFNDKIIDENDKKYFRIITNIDYPLFFFIGFDFSIISDINDKKGMINSLEKQNLLAFDRLKNNLGLIKSLIKESININNILYKLLAIVCSPYAGHFNGIIIDLKEDYHLLEKNKSYFYDGQKNNNEIIPITNWKEILDRNYPYILMYSKILIN